jgi:hypothetical protein
MNIGEFSFSIGDVKNRELRRIIGPKRDEVTRKWRNYVISSLMICTPHQILFGVIKSRGMRWAGHVARLGERRSVYRVLVGKPERKRPLSVV